MFDILKILLLSSINVFATYSVIATIKLKKTIKHLKKERCSKEELLNTYKGKMSETLEKKELVKEYDRDSYSYEYDMKKTSTSYDEYEIKEENRFKKRRLTIKK